MQKTNSDGWIALLIRIGSWILLSSATFWLGKEISKDGYAEPIYAIIGACITVLALEARALRSRPRKRGVDPYVDIKSLQVPINLVRKMARILFIDDEELLMIENLRMRGYNVFGEDDVSNIDDEIPVDDYHLVYVDVSGVGSKISENEGAEVIRRVKERFPTPCTLVYSAFSFRPGETKSMLLRLADSEFNKQSDTDEHVQSIDYWAQLYFSGATLVRQIARQTGKTEEDVAKEISEKTRLELCSYIDEATRVDSQSTRAIKTLFGSLIQFGV